MATVHEFMINENELYAELQIKADLAENRRLQRYLAARVIQRWTRGYLIRKYILWLNKQATTIQCAYRVHVAKKAYRRALERAVKDKFRKYYDKHATKIQALWRGHYSRKNIFCYKSYRCWLSVVKEKGERRAAEAAEFGLRSRADDLRVLEAEAKEWIAFVVFKLHHLLRTVAREGIYSDHSSTELSEFETLLNSIRYTEYMKRLKQKYNQYVKEHKSAFSNKRLFPVIGDGKDYWYMSLADMYDMTSTPPKETNTRARTMHHGPMHQKPFMWKRLPSPKYVGSLAPFKTDIHTDRLTKQTPDPRFYLYVQYYKPRPDLFDYVDFHINALLKMKEMQYGGISRKCLTKHWK
ncbi:Spermatogenesis-associated protein 17 [Eumeta japonica]|uniref:Spermatogenesis-associated protein 17 n=1 Tax=Eumeta variegata TaxID=151549 RepID=A0A4C1YA35_EUMVA|nr:Spermatogenesis-associated protein 17 [Eumeta japonica]